jgi:hypothetical protein
VFTIDQTPEFTVPVPILTPDGEGHREDSIRATFIAIPDSEMAELLETPDDAKTFLRRVVRDVADMVETDGKPVPFNAVSAAVLFDMPFVRLGLVRAYSVAIRKVKTGN